MNFEQAKEAVIERAKNCTLIKTAKNVVVHRGSTTPKILFIGEAPGFDEDEQGVPFIGKSGKLLDKWIADNKIESYAIINTVPLIPLEDGKIRAPTDTEINFFIDTTMDLIGTLKPHYIICVGKTASKCLNMKFVLSQWSEKEIDFIKENDWCDINVPVGFIYHPSYYMRKGKDGSDDFKNLINNMPFNAFE